MLNVVWSQLSNIAKTSVGVLSVVVMNLPRSKQFMQENVIIVGISPALSPTV